MKYRYTRFDHYHVIVKSVRRVLNVSAQDTGRTIDYICPMDVKYISLAGRMPAGFAPLL